MKGRHINERSLCEGSGNLRDRNILSTYPGGGDGGKVGGGGGSFFSQFYTRIDSFQIAKKNFAVFFRFLPRIITAIRGRGLEAEKRPNIAIVFPFL